MNRRKFLKSLALGGGAVCFYGKLLNTELLSTVAWAKDNVANDKYYRIVLLGDPHLPSREREHPDRLVRQGLRLNKDAAREDINSWDDVDQVNVLGDIVAQFANDEEYADCKNYFSKFKKPVKFVNGNHDYIYTNSFHDMHFVPADTESRLNKLERFKKTWNLPDNYYTQRQGRYLLIYLAVDAMDTINLAQMSTEQLIWLEAQLEANRNMPTIIFFHGPLNGTLSSATNKAANTPRFIAQPEEPLREIIKKNPQILLWVSGHTHTPATDPSYAAKINLYEGQVTNIHNADMDRKTIWSNSMYLYDDRIIIKTFDHKAKQWLTQLERTFMVPQKL